MRSSRGRGLAARGSRSAPHAQPLLSLLLLLSLTACCGAPVADRTVDRATDFAGVDPERLARIDHAVEAAIADGDLPGAVVLVWSRGRTAYLKAFGRRASEPEHEPMTVDTVFDLASLTKVIATTTAVMLLVEEGRVRLRAPVAQYLPGFERHGKARITVEQLLTHVSGLRPGLDLEQEFDGHDVALERTYDERPVAAPGEQFIYSDLNFMLLGEIVARVSGLSLDVFATQRVFEPLGMGETMFRPPAALAERIAPTEACVGLEWPCRGDAAGAVMLRGAVHDPTARRMGGVAGHAGLFSTAADLARFGEMLLAGGARDGVRILAPLTVSRMTSPAGPPRVARCAGIGLGYRFALLREPRRPVPGRLVRPYRLHRDVDLARPGQPDVRRVPLEPGASGRRGAGGGVARPGRDAGRRRGHGQARGAVARGRRSAAGRAWTPASTCSARSGSHPCGARAWRC